MLPLDAASQIQVANLVAAKGTSVRETEQLVYRMLNPRDKKVAPAPDRDLPRLQEELADTLGATVKIRANRKGAGELSIRFGDLDQLDGLLSRLR